MKLLLLLGVVFLGLGCQCKDENSLQGLRKSVFKIRAESQSPNYIIPWQKESVQGGTGTGFYIGNQWILTNAHVVSDAKFITVQRDGDAKKVTAKVLHIAHDCDLALLTVEDDDYFKQVKPLVFGGLPKLQATVATIGYPTGGNQVSITAGVVSRIDFRRYAHSGYSEHLLIQVDSAINPGNSGGPVMQDDKVVGVAFQSFTAAENTGYIIPSVIVERFLKDIKDDQYDGHPLNGVMSFRDVMSNKDMRSYYGVDRERGVIATYIPKHSPFYTKLLPEDIIVKVDDFEIGSDGTIVYEGERLNYELIYDLKQIGESTRFSVIRDGSEIEVEVIASLGLKGYFPGDIFAPSPRYIVYGGFVFTALSRNFLKSWGKKWYYQSPLELRYAHYYNTASPSLENYEEYIVATRKMNASVNQQIYLPNYSIVKSINNHPPKNLEEFKNILENTQGEYITIDFHFKDSPVVLPANLNEINDEINKNYNVDPPFWLGSLKEDTATLWKLR